MPKSYQSRQNRLKRKQYNERLKLLISGFHTIAMAIIISVIVYPVVKTGEMADFSKLFTWTWLLSGIILHLGAQFFLGLLKSEE